MAKIILFMVNLLTLVGGKFEMVREKMVKMTTKTKKFIDKYFEKSMVTPINYNHYIMIINFDGKYFFKKLFTNSNEAFEHLKECIKTLLPFFKNVTILGTIQFVFLHRLLNLSLVKWLGFLFVISAYELAVFAVIVSVGCVLYSNTIMVYSKEDALFNNVAKSLKGIVILIIQTWILLPWIHKFIVKIAIGFVVLYLIKLLMDKASKKTAKS
jgi:hypothetical protein